MGWKIVSRPDCKWCTRAKAHLAVRGVEFYEEVLETVAMQRAFKARTGLDTFPQIWDGDRHVGGFSDLKAQMA
ncbi:glutaredoxin domain-containing protein [Shinella zoogloeoides]|uniref:glutaredoxin domain-containing protein n=1 Tax=Shinella zoogloeoides TaxID=352475 RepID=UPI00273DEE00|nr:glutaredoxin domain-containing protein [Shinella zoogloeoides]WLR90892.1 glutaredoxin domain-containing protein [Shinella zoogloeoides]